MNRCCGECRHCEYEDISQGWICVNDQSEYLGDWVDYEMHCAEWEEREYGSNRKGNRK